MQRPIEAEADADQAAHIYAHIHDAYQHQVCWSVLECLTMCWSVLQFVIVCCSEQTLMHTPTHPWSTCIDTCDVNKSAIYTQSTYTAHILRLRRLSPGWRRPIECLKLQVFFRKRPKNYMGLLRKMTCKDKASCEIRHPVGLPPSCISIYIYIYIYIYTYAYIYISIPTHTSVARILLLLHPRAHRI